MSVLGWILGFTFVSGVLSALAASLFLALSDARRASVLPHLIGFATGTLLAAALTSLLPSALEIAGSGRGDFIGLILLGGILFFFMRLALWRHCHHDHRGTPSLRIITARRSRDDPGGTPSPTSPMAR
jgi:zinc and cadmium transporter